MWMNNCLLQEEQSVKKFVSDSLKNNKYHFNSKENVQPYIFFFSILDNDVRQFKLAEY